MRQTLRVVRSRVEEKEEEPVPVNPRPHELAICCLVLKSGVTGKVIARFLPVPGGFRKELAK